MFDVNQDYFDWLCDIVHWQINGKTYHMLLKDLHDITFVPFVQHDDNREADGLELREVYMSNGYYSWSDSFDAERPCSVLEMMIGLAQRIDFEMASANDDVDDTARYFWEMISNLDLDQYDDDNYIDLNGMENVYEIVIRMVDRTYSPDGNGGLFPLRRSHEDQRNVELWYQMNAWLQERYA